MVNRCWLLAKAVFVQYMVLLYIFTKVKPILSNLLWRKLKKHNIEENLITSPHAPIDIVFTGRFRIMSLASCRLEWLPCWSLVSPAGPPWALFFIRVHSELVSGLSLPTLFLYRACSCFLTSYFILWPAIISPQATILWSLWFHLDLSSFSCSSLIRCRNM